MRSRGELRIDPGQLGTDAFSGELGTGGAVHRPGLARALLRKAAALTAGLQARIALVAVHSVPFPADFRCSRRPLTRFWWTNSQNWPPSARCR